MAKIKPKWILVPGITGKRAASTKAGVCGYAALSADLQRPKTDRLIISGAIKFSNKVEIVSFTSLNQQNREYYSLRFAEVQKELAGMKVELGKN